MPSPRKPARRDWSAVEAAYIAGVDSQELARQFGIPAATIKSRASREGWGARRNEVATRVQRDLPARVAGALVDQAADDAIMSRDEVLRRLTAIARGGMHLLADWGPDGVAFKPSADLPDDVRSLVAEVGQTVNQHGKALRLKVVDPLSALKELARYHGVDQPAQPGEGGEDEGVVVLDGTSEDWLDG